MSFRTVLWTSNQYLECQYCLPANVYLCLVDPTLIVAPNCTGNFEAPGTETIVLHTIAAQLTHVNHLKNNCGLPQYEYSFNYDSSLIVSDHVLSSADINGALCDDCLTRFIKDEAGAPVRIDVIAEAPVPLLHLVNQDGCVYQFIQPGPFNVATNSDPNPVIVYPGDTLSILGDPNKGIATRSTTDGAHVDDVFVAVKLDTDPGNMASFGSHGGLFVSALSPGISADAGNKLTLGTDHGAYLNCAAIQSCITRDSAGYVAVDPSGANVVRHTALDGGPTFDFVEGFSNVNNDASCAGLGVGAGKMVRSVSIAGGILIVDAVPEHCFKVNGTSGTQNVNEDMSTLGYTKTFLSLAPLVISNPSPCRVFNGSYNLNASVNVIMQTLGVWRFDVQVNIGAGFVTIASTQWGTVPGTMGMPWVMPGSAQFTVAAGGSISITIRLIVTTLVGSNAGSQLISGAVGLTMDGGTC